MGLGSLFSCFRRQPGLTAKQVQKRVKLLTNPFAKAEVRMYELERLFAEKDDELALRGALRRFAVHIDSHIADEAEKKWLEKALIERGKVVLPALGDYIAAEQELSYALKAYRQIAGKEPAIEFFLKILQGYGPDDYRCTTAKLQLLWQLAEDLEAPGVLAGLIPFLQDYSDDICVAVVEILDKASEQNLLTAELQQLALGEMSSILNTFGERLRVQKKVAELLVRRNWPLREAIGELPPPLLEDYFVDKKNYLCCRVKKAS